MWSAGTRHPFNFARRISTLDHASKGRIAWNIVTNYLPNASRNFGLDGLTRHDDRYAWADEYVEVTYKLWEGSWEEDALRQDRASGIHADFDKVHKINHVGPRYQVEGPHLVSPSPQRTPLLFQAGASEAGRSFAARNAEAVNAEIPGSYEEFVEHVAPELQRRGLMRRDYAAGTLRHKLFGRGDRLPGTHPAARYRGVFASQPA
jgi:alkanesulfonate monooxygenase SsuD/methylene tetrahydromethanopterin reductase-like flavin-dependent oxidoreductase (luciferase family)